MIRLSKSAEVTSPDEKRSQVRNNAKFTPRFPYKEHVMSTYLHIIIAKKERNHIYNDGGGKGIQFTAANSSESIVLSLVSSTRSFFRLKD